MKKEKKGYSLGPVLLLTNYKKSFAWITDFES